MYEGNNYLLLREQMDQILKDLGISAQFQDVFRQKIITIKTFINIINSSENQYALRDKLSKEVGLSHQQILVICDRVADMVKRDKLLLFEASKHQAQKPGSINDFFGSKPASSSLATPASSAYRNNSRLNKLLMQPPKQTARPTAWLPPAPKMAGTKLPEKEFKIEQSPQIMPARFRDTTADSPNESPLEEQQTIPTQFTTQIVEPIVEQHCDKQDEQIDISIKNEEEQQIYDKEIEEEKKDEKVNEEAEQITVIEQEKVSPIENVEEPQRFPSPRLEDESMTEDDDFDFMDANYIQHSSKIQSIQEPTPLIISKQEEVVEAPLPEKLEVSSSSSESSLESVPEVEHIEQEREESKSSSSQEEASSFSSEEEQLIEPVSNPINPDITESEESEEEEQELESPSSQDVEMVEPQKVEVNQEAPEDQASQIQQETEKVYVDTEVQCDPWPFVIERTESSAQTTRVSMKNKKMSVTEDKILRETGFKPTEQNVPQPRSITQTSFEIWDSAAVQEEHVSSPVVVNSKRIQAGSVLISSGMKNNIPSTPPKYQSSLPAPHREPVREEKKETQREAERDAEEDAPKDGQRDAPTSLSQLLQSQTSLDDNSFQSQGNPRPILKTKRPRDESPTPSQIEKRVRFDAEAIKNHIQKIENKQEKSHKEYVREQLRKRKRLAQQERDDLENEYYDQEEADDSSSSEEEVVLNPGTRPPIRRIHSSPEESQDEDEDDDDLPSREHWVTDFKSWLTHMKK